MELTLRQKSQLDWADKWDYTYNHSIGRMHYVSCKTCKEHKKFSAPDSVRTFIIHFHKGHDTAYFSRK